jgi:hypothetical protein
MDMKNGTSPSPSVEETDIPEREVAMASPHLTGEPTFVEKARVSPESLLKSSEEVVGSFGGDQVRRAQGSVVDVENGGDALNPAVLETDRRRLVKRGNSMCGFRHDGRRE